jgi:formylglycine-generating enzyme required for sulfatase activity
MQGIGRQARGACNDVALSIKKPTPTMVVVPATSAQSKPYAIGKYEVSTSQLNDYCESTNDCSKLKGRSDTLPAVNVPPQIIESYTAWLSKETGCKYEIATYEQ